MTTIQTVKAAVHKAIEPVIKVVAPNAPIRRWGMTPEAFAAYLSTGYDVSRIVQTMTRPGHEVAASAGTHDQDGTANGIPYSVCVDIHVTDLSPLRVKALLGKFWSAGFAAWYRCADYPEDHWTGATHVHAVWAAASMKRECRRQVHDFLAVPAKTGLASHLLYNFAQPAASQQTAIRSAFLAHNPADG